MSECPCERDKTIDPWCDAAGMCLRTDEEEEMNDVAASLRDAAEHNRHYETLRTKCLEGATEIEGLRDGLSVAYGALLCIGGSDARWTKYASELTNKLAPLLNKSSAT